MTPSLQPGQIWTHERYYCDEAGKWHRKHVIVLAFDRAGNIVQRPFTSVATGRQTLPPCGHPPQSTHPAFYVGAGVVSVLPLPTWVDLYPRNNEDPYHWENVFRAKNLTFQGVLPRGMFCELLSCVARCDDITLGQANACKDQRSAMRCP